MSRFIALVITMAMLYGCAASTVRNETLMKALADPCRTGGVFQWQLFPHNGDCKYTTDQGEKTLCNSLCKTSYRRSVSFDLDAEGVKQ